MTEEPIIEIRGLVNGFGDEVLHDHIDLDVRRGEVLGVVGGSGTGKSVLLRSIVGLNRPRAGSIKVFGEEMRDLSGERLRHVQMRWGVLFQDGALFGGQTVAENIQVPMREHTRMTQSLMCELAAMKVSLVGLP
jgi:phospholipid/cholesterol/gamma-HCH transport system ATP-binding protein